MATFLTDYAPFFVGDDPSAASASLDYGLYEIGTGTATTWTLPAPREGAVFAMIAGSTSTATKTLVTNSTGVTLNVEGDRTVTFNGEGDSILLVGRSSTRWQVLALNSVTLS